MVEITPDKSPFDFVICPTCGKKSFRYRTRYNNWICTFCGTTFLINLKDKTCSLISQPFALNPKQEE